MAQHELVQEAALMGFDSRQAAAALVSFAKQTTKGDVKKLSKVQHGDAFIEFLINCPADQAHHAPGTEAVGAAAAGRHYIHNV